MFGQFAEGYLEYRNYLVPTSHSWNINMVKITEQDQNNRANSLTIPALARNIMIALPRKSHNERSSSISFV